MIINVSVKFVCKRYRYMGRQTGYCGISGQSGEGFLNKDYGRRAEYHTRQGTRIQRPKRYQR